VPCAPVSAVQLKAMSVMPRNMKAARACETIKQKCGPRVTAAVFQDEAWRAKGDALRSVGLSPAESAHFFEVSRTDAIDLVAAALSRDLCYGSRVMSIEDARRLVAPLFEAMHFQTRFFTNSEVPYHRRDPNAWAFNGISSGTIDTGVLFELAKSFVGVLWVTDID
jgi:hypothetical protein